MSAVGNYIVSDVQVTLKLEKKVYESIIVQKILQMKLN